MAITIIKCHALSLRVTAGDPFHDEVNLETTNHNFPPFLFLFLFFGLAKTRTLLSNPLGLVFGPFSVGLLSNLFISFYSLIKKREP